MMERGECMREEVKEWVVERRNSEGVREGGVNERGKLTTVRV